MDALARRQMWNMLRSLRERNLTIILTTHYIDEAQTLCGRVALMDEGKLRVVDTPENLIEALGKYAVDTMQNGMLSSRYFQDRREAIGYLSDAGNDASLRSTTLEDVFVETVGKQLTKR